MRKFWTVFFLMLLLPAFALADGNLAENGDFSELDEGGAPAGWYQDSWHKTGESAFGVSEDGYSGPCLYVENLTENDARYVQDVPVEPDSYYRLSCMVRAEAIGEEFIGANISAKNSYSYSEDVHDTDGEWVELVLYGKTGPEQTVLSVFLRVGGYSNLNTGRAWFDDVRVEQVDAIPEGYVCQNLTDLSLNAAPAEKEESTVPARYTPAWLLFCFAYILIVLGVVRKTRACGDDRAWGRVFGAVLALSLLIHVALAVSIRGHYYDMNCFSLWSERMAEKGPLHFYEEGYFCDYPPMYMLILAIPAGIRMLLGVEAFTTGHELLIKLIPILLDLAGAWLVYSLAKKRAGRKTACLLGAFLALNPAMIVDSAAWGQMDIVFTVLLAAAALLLTDRRYDVALPVFVLAALIKPQALLYAPLGLLSVLQGARGKENLKRAGIGVAASLLTIYAVAALVTVGKPGWNPVTPVTWIVELYGGTFGGYEYMTLNSCNLYEMLGLNWAPVSLHPALYTFAWVMFWGGYVYAAVLMLLSKKPRHIFLAAGALCSLIFAFGPMMHERYLFPAILLLAIAYCFDRDRRLLVILVGFTVTLSLNQVLVLQGALTDSNYGHLQASENWLNCLVSLANVALALYLAWVAFDIAVRRRGYSLSAAGEDTPAKKPVDYRLRLKKFDYIAMAAVTALYSVLAFTNLGTLSAPESGWTSQSAGEQVVFDLGETREFHLTYYGGICNTTFTVELSEDGETWSDAWHAQYNQGEIFRWLWYVPMDAALTRVHQQDGMVAFSVGNNDYPMQSARYVRLTAKNAGLTLYEVGFLDAEGSPLPASAATENAIALLDEQDTVPEHPSYYNSTYFDEIYHARTAFEHLHGLDTYEWTHPPLGKVMMMMGISIFGMCPFGWRFMGAVVGCLMLPAMYLIVKQLTKSTKLSLLAMVLLALDSMHFTQTRIATIDSYAVFWIMMEYLFMFRYENMMRANAPLKKALIPLGLSGIMMGLACATKWIGIYSAAGLAVIFFLALLRRYAPEWKDRRAWRDAGITCGFCVIFFIVIPLLIYYFSYWWQTAPEGGLSVERVWGIQKSILSYHSGLGGDTHYFRSEWYEWPVIWWPMWYYSGTDFVPAGMISSISCMGNPAVWWTGLGCLIAVMAMVAWRRKSDAAMNLTVIGFASQYLPWVLVPRSTFIYHYFASVPFLILAIALVLREIARADKKSYQIAAFAVVAAAFVLFFAFYPLESGLPVAREYAKYLRWFNWYNY